MAEKRSLLLDLLAEDVAVYTTQRISVQTESGEMAEIPHILEGVFVDFDEEWVLIDRPEGVTLVNRDRIIDISRVSNSAVVAAMDDPGKPDKGSMN